MEREDYNKLWQAITAIQAMDIVPISDEALQKCVEKNNSIGNARYLYHLLQSKISMHSEKNLRPILLEHVNKKTELNKLDELWTRFCQEMTWIQKIFNCLDETYLKEKDSLLSIHDLGLYFFEVYVLSCFKKDHLISALKGLIEKEEREKGPDQNLLKNLLNMLSDLGCNDILDVLNNPPTTSNFN